MATDIQNKEMQTSQLTQFRHVTHGFKLYLMISRQGLVFTRQVVIWVVITKIKCCLISIIRLVGRIFLWFQITISNMQ